jgi:hypothetical protein
VNAQTPKNDSGTKTPSRALKRLAEPWPSAERLRERREDAENRRLFQDEGTLEFTLAADFRSINRDRNPESTKEYPGTLTTVDDKGARVSMPVTLRARGHVRRNVRTCAFVPIRVEFTKGTRKDTVFERQTALKLVTHCQNSADYDQHVLREYLAYRILNVLTPRSFRARLAKTTYVDSMSGETLMTRRSMFIEDDDDVARRLEGRVIQLPRAMFTNVDRATLDLMMLFQYMIGNTDFSLFALHNVRLIVTPDRTMPPVPYDFDISGLVRPPYGIPDKRLPIADVRERLYRGPCRSVDEATGATFSAGNPMRVFEARYFAGFNGRTYDVSPDGRRFLMIKDTAATEPSAAATPASMVIVLNWVEEVKARAGTK